MLDKTFTNETAKQKDKTVYSTIIRHKINKLRDVITIEPLAGFYQLGIVLSKPAFSNLEFEKACRVNLGYNDTVCNAVLAGNHRNFSAENKNIQIIISKMHSWQQPVQSIIPLLLILFMGSFSDRHKWRKPFFILPIIGDILGGLGGILCVVNMKTWPLEVQGVLEKIVPSLFGSQNLLIMATTAYIADVIWKRPSNASHLYALLLLVTLHKAAYDGDNNLLYLYVQNVFQWTVVDYTYFLTAHSTLTLIGNLLGLCLFVKILGTGDLLILLITTFTRIVSNIILGCARSSFVLYISNVTGIVTKLYRTAKRAYATKIVSPEDIGKTQSLLSITEAIAPAVSVPLYNVIYVNTIQVFPGTTIFFSVYIYSICSCLIIWMYYYKKDDKNIKEKENFYKQGRYNQIDSENYM
ncbi:uncharacterized protein LOC126881986 isoform X2 [Diabrotica virgifera virgifera]|uniref:Uncharacterized protein LOC114337895 isoform X2 n=1 Tax=Diabrotica virgifera virgifera TaxID=50390 RepID=A0A6P7G5E7_DIAVI|nr:uncharacterized protein LOC126881986 isoform X2 [Diabrotica virgifera virgifera]